MAGRESGQASKPSPTRFERFERYWNRLTPARRVARVMQTVFAGVFAYHALRDQSWAPLILFVFVWWLFERGSAPLPRRDD